MSPRRAARNHCLCRQHYAQAICYTRPTLLQRLRRTGRALVAWLLGSRP